jgi:hypothetical protein
MAFRKLVERDGSGMVTLDKADLRVDGMVSDDGTIRESEMHIQRLARGAYLVRVVEDGTLPEIDSIPR